MLKYWRQTFGNGTGFRTTIFFTGCDLNPHCKGCFNSQIWNPSVGKTFTPGTIDKIIEVSNHEWCEGLSLLGGEPTASYNIESAIALCRAFKSEYPDKDIWMWSGRRLEEINELKHGSELLQLIDYLVDGRFEEDKKDLSLKFKGSSNQRIMKKMPLGFFVQID